MKKRVFSAILTSVLTATLIAGCGQTGGGEVASQAASDYSEQSNWLAIPEITKQADTIYFYPTAYNDGSEDAADICDIENEGMRESAQKLYQKQAVAFEEATNVFAPYYRQSNIYAVIKHSDNPEEFQKNEQRTDVFAALDYYFEHYNGGRPFLLAGHSQGSMMIRIVLDEYFPAHPELVDRFIATYAIGESFPQEWLEKHPYVKFAEGADDTGVIVAWNTEGPWNQDAFNMVVEEGAVSINPINWRRDDTYAPAEDNLGSLRMDEYGEYEIIPCINDARVDTERGVVICTTSQEFVPLPELFGEESLHGVDYDLYFENIRQNAKTRVNAYLKENGETTAIRAIDMEHHYYIQEFLDIAEARDAVPRYNSETKEIEYVDGVWMGLGPIIDKLLALDDSRVAEMDAYGLSAAMAELERCVNDYGFVSWHTHSNYGDTHIDGDRYRPILEKCAELGVYVYVHPSMPAYDRINDLGVMSSAAGLGFTLDTMTTLTAMITKGVFDDIPKLHVVTGHFGEALPFLLTRMDHFLTQEREAELRNTHDFSYYFKHNIWVTTSGNMQASAFELTKEMLGIDRILLATDYPYESLEEEMNFLNSLDLTTEERKMLYYGNAEGLMGNHF